MRKILLLFITNLIALISFAQDKPENSDSARKSVINIHLTNRSQQPLKHEEVLLSATKAHKYYNLLTDKDGRATTIVDAGYKYTIQLRTIDDTTTYGYLDVPELKPNEFYPSQMSIDMTYEPERHYVFHQLEFDFGKSTVKEESYKELDELVNYMQYKNEINIEIDGHTDNVGKEEENLKLSKQRALSVKYYLIHKGINSNRIKTDGFGSSQPIADNNTIKGQQKNRRTELKIL